MFDRLTLLTVKIFRTAPQQEPSPPFSPAAFAPRFGGEAPPRDDEPRPAAERLGGIIFLDGTLTRQRFLPSCMHKVTPE